MISDMGETKAAARRALLEFLAQWEATINGEPEDLKIAPLAQRADTLIDSIVTLVVERMKAAQFDTTAVHYLTENLHDLCGTVPDNVNVPFTARPADVTCGACRQILGFGARS